MSPQLYMSMHGLNNLININIQLERLDNINVQLEQLDNINNNNHQQQQHRQHQHYNLIDIHHLIATSYNHHVNSTYKFHITVHQHIYIPSCNISSTSYSYNNHQQIYIPSCNDSSIKLFIQNKAIRLITSP